MKLSADRPLIRPGCEIDGSSFGAFVEIGEGSRVAQSVIGDYSYCDRLCDIANATVGRFSNIASLVRIGATDHPLDRASCITSSTAAPPTGRTRRMMPTGSRSGAAGAR